MSARPAVVERVSTPRGEFVLRHDGEHYEVISNGTFLMDTRNGRSERALVTTALARHPAPSRVLIGGLGVGFSLRAALADDRVQAVEVVEIEPALLDWHRSHLATYTGGVLDHPKVTLVVGDVADHLRDTAASFDVICLDIDNGPDWTVTAHNGALYGDDGMAVLTSRLRGPGVLSVWSAARSPSYLAVLHRHFASVETHDIMVARGEPDVVMVGVAPHDVRRRDVDSDCS